MSDPTIPNDRRSDDESVDDRPDEEPLTGYPSGVADGGLPVPEPVDDEVTVELVRDAIGVARGELSDERFSRKYGTTSELRTPTESKSLEE
ncbi:hypothetical protein [Halorubrum sp. DTA98]|uniref:hypothetical protein n=1 Tax=Halorubrum sp. DTA98 TaxID=3402163 RepID=UPI003AAD2CB1